MDAHYYLAIALQQFIKAGYDPEERERYPFMLYWEVAKELNKWPQRLEPLLNPERRTWQHVLRAIEKHTMVSPCFPKSQIELFIYVNQAGNLVADWRPPGGWLNRKGHERVIDGGWQPENRLLHIKDIRGLHSSLLRPEKREPTAGYAALWNAAYAIKSNMLQLVTQLIEVTRLGDGFEDMNRELRSAERI